jgi:hypothetical protein
VAPELFLTLEIAAKVRQNVRWKQNTAATSAATGQNGDVRQPGHIDGVPEGRSIGNVSRGDWRCTLANDSTGLGLVLQVFPKRIAFAGHELYALVEPGRRSKPL